MATSRRANDGFTLLEMLVVVMVIGIAMALVLPNLDNLTPKHRLRSAAREVASTMELCRHLAITKVATFGLRYDVEAPGGFTRPQYVVLLPPDEDGRRESLTPKVLPEGVLIRAVHLGSHDEVTNGEALVDFNSGGQDGAHIVVLENEVGQVLSVKFQPLVGLATFYDDEVRFAEFRGGF